MVSTRGSTAAHLLGVLSVLGPACSSRPSEAARTDQLDHLAYNAEQTWDTVEDLIAHKKPTACDRASALCPRGPSPQGCVPGRDGQRRVGGCVGPLFQLDDRNPEIGSPERAPVLPDRRGGRVPRQRTPETPVIGEESATGDPLPNTCWLLDPIDGTLNFTRGAPGYALSLAFVKDRQPSLGVIDSPALGRRWTTGMATVPGS
ncbi:inositol monophosphatase family protein [Streptomyces sp. NPDC058092]|uniref:inositol monophosphatase family protein n=1 Tax=Streptomyces sp. NPDC058092 TaxID=3346336 RepID=UPI0036E32D1C